MRLLERHYDRLFGDRLPPEEFGQVAVCVDITAAATDFFLGNSQEYWDFREHFGSLAAPPLGWYEYAPPAQLRACRGDCSACGRRSCPARKRASAIASHAAAGGAAQAAVPAAGRSLAGADLRPVRRGAARAGTLDRGGRDCAGGAARGWLCRR